MPAGNMQTKIFMKIGTIKYDVGYRYKNVWQNRKFLFGIIYLLCTQDFPHKWHFLPTDTHTYVCVWRGKEVSFSEYFAYVLSEWSLHTTINPLWTGMKLTNIVKKILFVASRKRLKQLKFISEKYPPKNAKFLGNFFCSIFLLTLHCNNRIS